MLVEGYTPNEYFHCFLLEEKYATVNSNLMHRH